MTIRIFSALLLCSLAACSRTETRNNRPLPEVSDNVLNMEKVQIVVQKDLPRLKSCVKKVSLAQKKAVPKGAQIVVRMLINGSGVVKEASKDFANFKNTELDNCATEYVYSLRFPPTVNGNDVDISYPFSL